MNLSSILLNNVINVLGLKIPTITLIFSGIVLGLIIITSVITGVVSKKVKNQRKTEEVKKVAPTQQAKATNDDGVYAINRHSEEIANSEENAESEAVASDEHIEEETVATEQSETFDDDDYLVEDDETESVDESIDKILAGISQNNDIEDEYETEDFSDDDTDALFTARARESLNKADVEDEVDFDIDQFEETAEEIEETAEEIEEIEEQFETEEIAEELEEQAETEEVAEELEEQSETEEIATELEDEIDLIVPSEEHTTDEDIVFIVDPEPETITPVVEETEQEPEVSEEEKIQEQTRLAEEIRRQAEEEYQKQLRQSEEEHKEQLRLAEEEAQRQRAELEAQKERERAELEERFKRMDEEKQARLAQLTEDSKRMEDRLSATEAMVALLEAHNMANEETASEVAPPELEDIDDEEPEDEELSIKASKYKRSFTSKLIQSDESVKKFYSELRNELLSYNKMRCSSAWQGDTYIAGRKTVAKILMGGKTLCLYLSLNPDEFNPNTYHHKDKSASKKYAQTPFQMRIKSELSMRRAISLIVVMMSDNGLEKNPKYARTDIESTLAYKDDETLLAEGLIKLNINAIEVVDKTLDEQDYEQERAEQEKMPKNYREVKLVKKGQVGNISQEDVGKINKTKKVEQVEENPNASKTGKFVVVEENGEYKFVLYAPDGKSIFESKTFKTYQGARNAIDSFRIAIADPQNSSLGMLEGEYIYTIKYSTTFISAPFKTKVSASRSLNLIKRTSAVANVEE